MLRFCHSARSASCSTCNIVAVRFPATRGSRATGHKSQPEPKVTWQGSNKAGMQASCQATIGTRTTSRAATRDQAATLWQATVRTRTTMWLASRWYPVPGHLTPRACARSKRRASRPCAPRRSTMRANPGDATGCHIGKPAGLWFTRSMPGVPPGNIGDQSHDDPNRPDPRDRRHPGVPRP